MEWIGVISPPKRVPKNIGSHELENQQSVPSYLILGPHAKVPKIHFEEVKLGKSKKQTLIIRNPTESPVNLRFVKKPNADFKFSCDIDDILSILERDQLIIEITWTPKTVDHVFEACHLVNSLNGIKLSVHLLGKCVAPPQNFKAKGVTRRRPLLVFPGGSSATNILQPKKKTVERTLEFSKTNTKSKSDPILILKPKDSSSNEILKTPPPRHSSAIDLIDNFAFPFTPESSLRRETFTVEKDTENDQNDNPPQQTDSSIPTGSQGGLLDNGNGNCIIASSPIMKTPAPKSTLGMMMDNFSIPFTPEPEESTRRETFIVEKDKEAVSASSSEDKDKHILDADIKYSKDLDETMAELENLENLVHGFLALCN